MRKRVTVVVALAISSIVAPHTGHAAKTAWCGDKRATIIAAPSGLTKGTPGDDVIFTASSDPVEIRAGRGDDLVCATGVGHEVSGGSGNDDIRMRGGSAWGDGGNDSLKGIRREGFLRGGHGADEYSQGNVDYSHLEGPVIADMEAGIALGEGRDRLLSSRIDVRGSRYADSLTGCTYEALCRRVMLSGWGGDDTIASGWGSAQGGGGDDTIEGSEIVDPGHVFIWLRGGPGADSVHGGVHGELIFGGPGHDELYGNGGHDEINSLGIPHYEVGIVDGDVMDGGEGNDRIMNGWGDDDISGGDPPSQYWTLQGDTLTHPTDVPPGFTGSVIDLAAETAVGLGNDSVTGFENVYGTPGADTITGTDADERLYDEPWYSLLATDGDSINGGGGDDHIWVRGHEEAAAGGPGHDVFSLAHQQELAHAQTGVVVDLAAGTMTGGWSATLSGLEEIIGTMHGDILRGDEGINWLYGHLGNDVIEGRGGNDVIDGDIDYQTFTSDSDEGDGGEGADDCQDFSVQQACEQPAGDE